MVQWSVSKEDEERRRWILHLFDLSPWDKGLYDMLLPTDFTAVDAVVAMIAEHAGKPPIKTTQASHEAMMGCLFTAEVQQALVQKGHDLDLDVSSDEGLLTFTIPFTQRS